MVTNNIQEKQVVKEQRSSLQNIQQRYAILSDKRVIIGKQQNNFVVKLPMLSQQISVAKPKETQESFLAEKRYQKAKEQVEQIKGFYGNLISYCLVIPFLWWLNFRTTSFLWAIFPTIGWGFGVLMHGLEWLQSSLK